MFRVDKYIDKGLWAAGSQLLYLVYGVIAIFLVVRVLPQEEFGLYILSQGIVQFVVMISGSMVYNYMVRELSVVDWDPVLPFNSFVLSLSFHIVIFAPFIYLSDQISTALNTPLLAPLLLNAIPIQLGGLFLINFFRKLIISSRNPKKLFALNGVYFGLLSSGLLYLNITGELTTAKQVIYLTAASGFGSAVVGWLFSQNLLKRSRVILSFVHQKRILNFGKYVVGASSANTIASSVDSYIIAYILGPLQVAFYNSAKVLFRFYQTISQMMDITVFPYGSKLAKEGRISELTALYEKILCFIYVVLLPVNVVAIIFMKPLFEFIYGDRYEGAYIIMQLLIVSATLGPAVSLSAYLIFALGKPKTVFAARIFQLIVTVVAGIFLIQKMGTQGMAWAYISGMFVQVYFLTLKMKSILPVTLKGVLMRVKDIVPFIKNLLRLSD